MADPIVTIRQLESPSKVLKLTSWAAPRGRFEIGAVAQRGRVLRHPGAEQGIGRLNGREDLPSEFEAVWEDRHLHEGEAKVTEDGTERDITDARELVRFAGGMVADQVLVSVEAFGFEPIGIFRRIEPARIGGRPERWECDLRFEWVSPGRLKAAAGQGLAKQDAQSGFSKMMQGWSNALSKAAMPANVARRERDDIVEQASTVTGQLQLTQNVVGQYEDIGASGEAGGSLAGAFRGVAVEAKSLGDKVDVPGANLVQTGAPLGGILSDFFQATVRRAARDLKHQAALLQRRFERLGQPDVIGIHHGRKDEDLRLVAYATYGRAALWRRIAEFNHLRSSTLDGGERILLPAVPR